MWKDDDDALYRGPGDTQEGRIAVDGRPVLDVERRINVPTHKRNIGMVFQSYAIWPHKTVFENVAFPLRMQGMKSKTAAGRVSTILKKVGLAGFEDRGASLLSGGQMQRVALARSIAMQPSVLLFDEPLSNLDARLRENLRFEIRALQQEFGFTAVYVTHDQSEALALGDEIAVMKAGRIVQQGDPIELYRNPVSGFVAAFLGVGNIFRAQVIGREAGGTRVRIDGTSLEMLSSSVAEVGERVIATVRDEDVKVTARGAEGVTEANSITGTVRVGSFLGSEVHYQCVVGHDLTMKSSMPAVGSPFPNGENVTISIARMPFGSSTPTRAPRSRRNTYRRRRLCNERTRGNPMISDTSTAVAPDTASPGVGDPPPEGLPRIRGRRRFDYRSLSPATYFLIVLAPLIVIPMALIAYASFARTPPRAGKLEASFTLENFAFLWSDAFLESTKNSLIIGVGGTALAMIIGGTLAWLAARTNVPGRQLIQVAGVVPLFISALVGALAWSIIGSPKFGYINLLLEQLNIDLNVNTYSMGGIIFVLGLYNAPYTFLFSYNAFALMNPEVEEAASVHGANGRRVARLITFPLVAPALFSSGILTFILVMENFPVPYVLGSGRIPTLPTDLYLMISASPARPGDASALGVVLVVMVFALVYIQRRILKKRNYTTVTGKGLRPRRIDLGYMRWPAFAFAALYLVLAVILPYFALLQSSLRTNSFIPNLGALFDWSALSLDHYVRLGSYEPFQGALLMTIQIGLIAALVGAALSFLIAYFVHRTKLPGRGIVDYITNIPIALPALVIGIGLLWTFLVMPFPIYGTAAAWWWPSSRDSFRTAIEACRRP